MLRLAVVIDVISVEDLIEDIARWGFVREIFQVFGVGPLPGKVVEAAHDFREGLAPGAEVVDQGGREIARLLVKAIGD